MFAYHVTVILPFNGSHFFTIPKNGALKWGYKGSKAIRVEFLENVQRVLHVAVNWEE